MHESGEKTVQGFGKKARRKETTWKIRAQMGGCDQNGSWGEWLGVWSEFNWLTIRTCDGLL
jgi:hypothetical protein